MITKRILLFSIYILGLKLLAGAQQKQINFTSLTTEDGLSSNTVISILKDSYGMVWLGTEDGLDKFDGTRFTVYRHNPADSTSLRSNEILSLHEDKKGNLWIGTSGGSLSLYDRTKDRFIHFPSGKIPNGIKNNVIRSVCSDQNGKIWLAHFDGVEILDPATKQITDIPALTKIFSTVPDIHGMCLFEDSHKMMWIGTTQGLYQYNANTKSIQCFSHFNADSGGITKNVVFGITEDHHGNIWVATNKGLISISPGSYNIKNYRHDNKDATTLSSSEVNAVTIDGDNLWVGTNDGLNIMDLRTGTITRFGLDPRNIHSLSAKGIRCIYIDKQGIYWIGTIRGGVDKYDKNLNLFNYVKSNVFDDKGLSASIVSSFAEAEKGKLFVGTDGGGVSLFSQDTKLFRHYNIISKRNGVGNRLTVLALQMTRNDQLLIGTSGDGLFTLNPASGAYRQYELGAGLADINSNDIYCISKLRDGNIWIGTNGEGFSILKPDLTVITRYTPNPRMPYDKKLPINGYIRDIKEDREGNIWIATHGGGIAVLEPATEKFTIYNTLNSKLPNDKVQSLLEDSRGQVWAGTFGGGLASFNKKDHQFTVYSEKDGLQNSTIYKIVEDKAGLIWVSTNRGVSSIDLATKNINNFNYHNGLQNNNFFHGSGILLSDGELFFGGLDGFNYFYPASLIKNKNIPPVLITELRISNQTVAPSENGPIQEHISIAKEINLDYKQNFALDFVGLSYTTPEQNRYQYKLEGFEKEWNNVGNTTTASYTNLDPGDYVFKIRASNNDGVWNEAGASIQVHVHPPIWRTVYAYFLYAVLLIGILLYIRHLGIRKIKRRFALDQEKLLAEQERREAERIHELDRVKIKFLTNLSHEFRTPISLILGPANSLLAQEKDQQSFRQLDIIRRNARRLLNLVNQLLDFRKMEVQELKFNGIEGELIGFVREVSDSFKDLAERKKIDFGFSSSINALYTSFDHDKLERILFNVLSNAFKFTIGGGKIAIHLEETDATTAEQMWVAIKISDTGIGIPADKQEKIFDLFFQNTTDASILNQGTGIGLSITKEFVKMHGGTIEVDSEPEQGTTFTILLPFTPLQSPAQNTLPEAAEAAFNESAKPEFADTNDNKQTLLNPAELPTILLVEDNDDFRFYIKDNLRSKYKIIEAANGKAGWQKALAMHPQLIVSDINMPEMDGIELCRKLKADKRTAHIPILLLTALTGEEDQLKGLNTGASDYITKPFNVELLNAKIKNLLQLNITLKNTYSKQIKGIFPEVKVESADEKLLQTIMQYLEKNLSNPQLSVEEMSKHVGMSRSSLYSKLLELTGQTPVEYIRSVKLDKAAVLLEKSDMNVAQIAYSVGFSTPNYFAKSFKAKFDMLPSEYINKMRKDSTHHTDEG